MADRQNAAGGSERMLEIGEKLAAVRKAKGMTQVQAAAAAGKQAEEFDNTYYGGMRQR